MTENRGRPQFEPTAAQRLRVERLKAFGKTNAFIAASIGIERHALARHFAEELTSGRAKQYGETVDGLFKKARAGNVAALKHCEMLIREADGGEQLQKYERIGKKEMARRELEAAPAGQGTSWEELLTPVERAAAELDKKSRH